MVANEMKFTGAEGAIIEEEERKFFKGNHFSFCFMEPNLMLVARDKRSSYKLLGLES